MEICLENYKLRDDCATAHDTRCLIVRNDFSPADFIVTLKSKFVSRWPCHCVDYGPPNDNFLHFIRLRS